MGIYSKKQELPLQVISLKLAEVGPKLRRYFPEVIDFSALMLKKCINSACSGGKNLIISFLTSLLLPLRLHRFRYHLRSGTSERGVESFLCPYAQQTGVKSRFDEPFRL